MYPVLSAALLIQLVFLHHINIGGCVPDIMLICVVFFGLFSGEKRGFEAGIAGGIMEDIFCLDFFWINTFIFALVGLTAGMLNEKFFRESKMTQSSFVFFFTVFSMSLHFALAAFFSEYMNADFPAYLVSSVLPAAVYTSIVSVPIFSMLVNWCGLRESEELL